MGALRNRIRRARTSAACLLLLATTTVLASSARFGRPLFEVKPDPPSAGQDVEVTYYGNNDSMVVFRIGDGEDHSPKIGKGKKFTIPKKLLKAGAKLYILDPMDGTPNSAVCFNIEP